MYEFEAETGLWFHGERPQMAALRLDDLSYSSGRLECESVRLTEPLSVLPSYLEQARELVAGIDPGVRSPGGSSERRVRGIEVVPAPLKFGYNGPVSSGQPPPGSRPPGSVLWGTRLGAGDFGDPCGAGGDLSLRGRFGRVSAPAVAAPRSAHSAGIDHPSRRSNPKRRRDRGTAILEFHHPRDDRVARGLVLNYLDDSSWDGPAGRIWRRMSSTSRCICAGPRQRSTAAARERLVEAGCSLPVFPRRSDAVHRHHVRLLRRGSLGGSAVGERPVLRVIQPLRHPRHAPRRQVRPAVSGRPGAAVAEAFRSMAGWRQSWPWAIFSRDWGSRTFSKRSSAGGSTWSGWFRISLRRDDPHVHEPAGGRRDGGGIGAQDSEPAAVLRLRPAAGPSRASISWDTSTLKRKPYAKRSCSSVLSSLRC